MQLYRYAGNNPVKYVDPDGRDDVIRLTSSELTQRNVLFSKILSYVISWSDRTNRFVDQRTTSDPVLYFKQATISAAGIAFLRSISAAACTAGAISLRNKYRTRDILVNGWAIDLRESSEIEYYRDTTGVIINDPTELSKMLKVGDVLIYSNPDNPMGIKGEGWTGHTATIIDIDSTCVTTVEWHEKGTPPTIQKLRKDTLQWFGDTKLVGGGSWK